MYMHFLSTFITSLTSLVYSMLRHHQPSWHRHCSASGYSSLLTHSFRYNGWISYLAYQHLHDTRSSPISLSMLSVSIHPIDSTLTLGHQSAHFSILRCLSYKLWTLWYIILAFLGQWPSRSCTFFCDLVQELNIFDSYMKVFSSG